MQLQGIVILLAYAFALMLILYNNKSIVLSDIYKPKFMIQPTSLLIFRVIKILLTYGSIASIWYFYGLYYGIGAFLFRMAFGKISLHYYISKQIKIEAQNHIDFLGGDPPDSPEYRAAVNHLKELMGEGWEEKTDSDIREEAFDVAYNIVMQRVRGVSRA